MSNTTKLAGIISTSSNPAEAAEFYRTVFGILYAINQHGAMPPHFECDVDGIHFAILKGPKPVGPGSVVPSFQVDDMEAFLSNLREKGIQPLHKTLELGGGPRVSTIADPDGNHIRLYAEK